MKTRKSTKLQLHRETLRTLDPQTLAVVGGGTDTRVVIWVTTKVVVATILETIEESLIC